MTETEVKINDALAKAGGKLSLAAIILGVPMRKLKGQIEASETLSKLVSGVPPSESEVLKPIVMDLEKKDDGGGGDAAVTSLVEANDNALCSALQAAGFQGMDIEHASALQNLAVTSMKGTFQLMHGGLTTTFLACISERNAVMEILRGLIDRLKDTSLYPLGSKERWRVMTEAQQWQVRIREIDDSVIRTNEVLHKGALALAERRSGAMQKRKPGFSSAKKSNVVEEELP